MKNQRKEKEMSIIGHLDDLRRMLIRSILGILLGGVIAYIFSDFIFDVLIFGPKDKNFITYQFFCEIAQAFGSTSNFCNNTLPFDIQNRTMDGQFSVLIWTCITAGTIISFPWILYQIWLFIAPALYSNEKKLAKTFIFFSSLLFFMGVVFGYYIIVPLSLNFLSNIQVSEIIENKIDVNSYIALIKTTSLATGLVFELPMVIYFLTRLGLVDKTFLKTYRKYAIVIILILSAVITPPDIISQIIVSIPLIILYECSIFIAGFTSKIENKSYEVKRQ